MTHVDDDTPARGENGASQARTGRQQQPRAAATRHALLVAAGEQFAAHGYHATSLNDLLRDRAARARCTSTSRPSTPSPPRWSRR